MGFFDKKTDKNEPAWKKKQRALEEKQKQDAKNKKDADKKAKAAAKQKAKEGPAWKQKQKALEEKQKKAAQKQMETEQRAKDAVKLKAEATKRKAKQAEERKKTVEQARLNKAKADALAARAKIGAAKKRSTKLMSQTVDPFASGLRQVEGFSVGKFINMVFGTASTSELDDAASKKARRKALRGASQKELDAELSEAEQKAKTKKRTVQLAGVTAGVLLSLVYLGTMVRIVDRSEPLLGSYKLQKFIMNGQRVVSEGTLEVTSEEFHLRLFDWGKEKKPRLVQKGSWTASGPYVRATSGTWKWIYSFKGENQERLQLEILEKRTVRILLFNRELKKS